MLKDHRFRFKVPLTPQNFFLLLKYTSFSDFISEKIFSIDKILAFLQAFEPVMSMFTTSRSAIWFGLLEKIYAFSLPFDFM